jgi:hypothetical protein
MPTADASNATPSTRIEAGLEAAPADITLTPTSSARDRWRMMYRRPPCRTTTSIRFHAVQNPVEKRQKRAWWLPLLIPSGLTVIALISAFSAKTHVVHPHAFQTLIGWAVIILAIGPPSFFAGIRFIQQAPPRD